jgi:hypothetical protein
MKATRFLVFPLLLASVGSARAEDVVQKYASGTILRGTTVCVGPIAPSGTVGVQISGYTNGSGNLTWQVYAVASDGTETLVYARAARTVDRTISPSAGVTYEACVTRGPATAEDFSLALNSTPLE